MEHLSTGENVNDRDSQTKRKENEYVDRQLMDGKTGREVEGKRIQQSKTLKKKNKEKTRPINLWAKDAYEHEATVYRSGNNEDKESSTGARRRTGAWERKEKRKEKAKKWNESRENEKKTGQKTCGGKK